MQSVKALAPEKLLMGNGEDKDKNDPWVSGLSKMGSVLFPEIKNLTKKTSLAHTLQKCKRKKKRKRRHHIDNSYYLWNGAGRMVI